MYCTAADITREIGLQALIEITDDSATPTTANIILTDEFILASSRQIDSYLRGRYTVPVTNEEDWEVLRPICISLTICALYARRLGLEYPQSLAERRATAIADLVRLQRGTITLVSNGVGGRKPGSYAVSKRKREFGEGVY